MLGDRLLSTIKQKLNAESPATPYVCLQCGAEFELEYYTCPNCGGYRVERSDWTVPESLM